jgi:hypothetical protein
MRWILFTLIFGAGIATTTHADVVAAPKSKVHKKHALKKKVAKHSAVVNKGSVKKHELQTDVKFDDSVLHGQYQTPDEALARVENEKALSDLLGVRKHFKDRLATASETE